MPFRTAVPLAALLAIIALSATLAQTEPAHPDPIVMMPNQFKWTGSSDGAKGVTVFGDPRKAGPFIFIVDWTSKSVSKPHYHTKTRTIIVLKGHWDFGSGPQYDLNNMKVIPEGGAVIVPAGSILYDGCKQPPCMVEIVGDGDDAEFMVDDKGETLQSHQPPAR
jgi:hypothetical protein